MKEEPQMKTYLILETCPGLVDGYYNGWEINAEGMAEHWDERRPRFKHIAVEVVGGLSDHQMMNQYCHAPAGGDCSCVPGMDERCRDDQPKISETA